MVAYFSTEADYRYLAYTVAEVHWLCSLLCDLHIPLSTVPLIWCDNVTVIHLHSTPFFHARTKHIEINYRTILFREKVAYKQFDVQFSFSFNQGTDRFDHQRMSFFTSCSRSSIQASHPATPALALWGGGVCQPTSGPYVVCTPMLTWHLKSKTASDLFPQYYSLLGFCPPFSHLLPSVTKILYRVQFKDINIFYLTTVKSGLDFYQTSLSLITKLS